MKKRRIKLKYFENKILEKKKIMKMAIILYL